MEENIPDMEWTKELKPFSDLVISVPDIEQDIDPITGERRPYECEGCSA